MIPRPNFNSDSISWVLGLSNEVSFVSGFSLKGGQNSQNEKMKILLYVCTCQSVYALAKPDKRMLFLLDSNRLTSKTSWCWFYTPDP